MEKIRVENLLDIPEEYLRVLSKGRSTPVLEFVEKNVHIHGKGYFVDSIIFKKNEEYYTFLVIQYLENEVTYTVPYQVFPETVEVVRTNYSPWVDKEEA